MMYGGFKSLSILCASVAILASCTSKPSQEEVLARVDNRVIRVKDFFNLYETLKPKDISVSGRERSEIKNLVLKALVRRAVILSEAERKKIVISDAELEQGLKKMKEGYSPSGFEESLLEQMVDEKEWREQVRQSLLIDRLFQKTEPKVESPSLKEALQFYQDNPGLFRQNATADALHIVVPDKTLADDIAKKLKASPATFVSLAKQHSTGPEAQENAMIHIDKDALPEELDRALFEGKVGEISNVIQSPYGFHILKVIRRTPAINKSFEDVRDSISKRLAEESRRAWLLKFEEKLIREAQIEYNRPLIESL